MDSYQTTIRGWCRVKGITASNQDEGRLLKLFPELGAKQVYCPWCGRVRRRRFKTAAELMVTHMLTEHGDWFSPGSVARWWFKLIERRRRDRERKIHNYNWGKFRDELMEEADASKSRKSLRGGEEAPS
jgi:hypothetical protein